MATFYIDTGGNAANSGSTDGNSPTVSGTAASVSGTTVTLDALTDLSGVITTAGATQSTIFINDATNSNCKIFKISATAGSGGATPTVTVTVAPTGTIAASAWRIGGRHLLTNANIEGAVLAGDTVIFNNGPASSASSIWTFRTAGDNTNGPAKIVGKSGSRPVLLCTGNTPCVGTGGLSYVQVENLEVQNSNGTGGGVSGGGAQATVYNVKISDAGTAGAVIPSGTNGMRIMMCEIASSSIGGDGIQASLSFFAFGNYIHDVAGNGISTNGTSPVFEIINNIIDTCGGRGIYFSSASAASGNIQFMGVIGNTIYGCGNSGLESGDVDNAIILLNNIISNNGNAAGEFNIEYPSQATDTVFHGYNVVGPAGSGSGGNLSNFTLNATESSVDPAMTDPANADFSIGSSSSAFATGFPGQFLGANLGRMNIGALQNNSAAGGSSMLVHPGMVGGMRG